MTCAHGGLISETRKKSIHVGPGSCFGHDIRTLRGMWKWTRIGIWLLRSNAWIRGRWGEYDPRLLRFDTIIYGDGFNPPTSPSILLRILPSVPCGSLESRLIICRSTEASEWPERTKRFGQKHPPPPETLLFSIVTASFQYHPGGFP